MADIEDAIYSRLTTGTTVVGLRVYPSLIDDSTTATPYIIYEKTSGEHVKCMTGMVGIAEAEFNILCVTSGTSAYNSAKSIRNSVRLILDGKTGTWGGVNVRACFINDEFDDPEYAIGKDQQRRQAVGLRTHFWFRESTT